MKRRWRGWRMTPILCCPGTPGWRQARWASGSLTVAYAMNTYGADRFDDLVVGLTKAEDWEALTLSVFGVSAQEFEAGWHAYLRWRYGLE